MKASEDIATEALLDLRTNLTLVNFINTEAGMQKRSDLNLASSLMADAMATAFAAHKSRGPTQDFTRAIRKVGHYF